MPFPRHNALVLTQISASPDTFRQVDRPRGQETAGDLGGAVSVQVSAGSPGKLLFFHAATADVGAPAFEPRSGLRISAGTQPKVNNAFISVKHQSR
jgi:hypothetical protein